MKAIFCLVLLTSVAAFAEQTKAKVKEESKKVVEKITGEKEKDCDKKKPIEIKPESISLSGNTGCSLDQSH